MKIRQSFVANSSSSSYLIVGIKDKSDIDLSYNSQLESLYLEGKDYRLVGKVSCNIHGKEVKLYCGERYC